MTWFLGGHPIALSKDVRTAAMSVLLFKDAIERGFDVVALMRVSFDEHLVSVVRCADGSSQQLRKDLIADAVAYSDDLNVLLSLQMRAYNEMMGNLTLIPISIRPSWLSGVLESAHTLLKEMEAYEVLSLKTVVDTIVPYLSGEQHTLNASVNTLQDCLTEVHTQFQQVLWNIILSLREIRSRANRERNADLRLLLVHCAELMELFLRSYEHTGLLERAYQASEELHRRIRDESSPAQYVIATAVTTAVILLTVSYLCGCEKKKKEKNAPPA
eukprot:m.168440 g.168440  ORF g.168440 m.168440 type:complete len:272 (+) comp9910_c1_seq4:363-1178(+)